MRGLFIAAGAAILTSWHGVVYLLGAFLVYTGAKMARLPMVIGNYHFHPGEQAEYRVTESLAEMLPNIMKV